MDPFEVERIIGLLALLGGVGVRILEMTRRESWRLSRDLAHRAHHDNLTRLLNRRALFEQGKRRIGQARRGQKRHPVSCRIKALLHRNAQSACADR